MADKQTPAEAFMAAVLAGGDFQQASTAACLVAKAQKPKPKAR